MANATQINTSASHVIDLTGWLLNINREVFFEAIDYLELRKDNDHPMLFQRLMRRLAGDYQPEDFIANEEFDNEEDLRFHRDEKLVSYFYEEGQKHGIPADPNMIQTLNATILEHASRKNPLAESTHADQESNSQEHSNIEASSTSTETNCLSLSVTQNTHKTTFAPTAASSQINLTNVTTSINGPISTTQSVFDNTVLCTLQNGLNVRVPREVAVELYNYQHQVKLLEAGNANASQQQSFVVPPHLSQQRTVAFNDTFDINYYNTSVPINANRTNTPQSMYNPVVTSHVSSSVNNVQVPLTAHYSTSQENYFARPYVQSSSPGQSIFSNARPTQQNLWSGRNSVNDARPMQNFMQQGLHPVHNVLTSTSLPSHTQAPPSSYFNQTLSKPYDVGRTVRAWNIKFSGEKGESIDNFLQRIEECSVLANIQETDLLNATTEMLTGVALQWCRQEKHKWTSWADFKHASTQRFGIDKRYQDLLTLEAQNRTQHPEEPTSDYIDRLLTLLNALEEKWSSQRQLDLLISNLHPKARRYIPRERITNIDILRLYAKEADFLIEAEKSYKLPTPAEKALRPDTAFVPKNKPAQKPNNAISAVNHIKKPAEDSNKNDDLKSLISKLVAEELKSLKPKEDVVQKKKDDTNSHDSKKSSPQRTTSDSEKTTSNTQAKNNSGKKFGRRKPRFKSTKNAEKPPGPLEKLVCYGCAWPGYYYMNCPECSLPPKDRGSD